MSLIQIIPSFFRKGQEIKEMSLSPCLRNYINNILFILEKFMAEEKIERQKAKSKGFATLGVPVGSTLTFRKDSAVTCKTVDEKNKVEYQGKVYPISGLAKELMKTPISGYHAFKYGGVLLAKLGEAQKSSVPASPPVSKPAETASVVATAPATPVPQTVPLPRPQKAPVRPQEATTAGNEEAGEIPLDPLEGFIPDEETEA
jgi:hypothetical protein